jgi:hypothetical protein
MSFLPVRRHPLIEDGAAAFEGDPARRRQHVGQRLRRLKEMNDDVQCVDRPLVEELEKADRRTFAAVSAPVTIVSPTGEGDGIGAMGVRLLGVPSR